MAADDRRTTDASPIRSIDDLPAPPGLPLIGNAYEILRSSSLHRTFERWADRYGPLIRVEAGRRRGVLVSDIDEINAILRDRPDGFQRWSDQQKISQELMRSSSLVYAKGDDWKRQRRLVVKALNVSYIHRYFDIIVTGTERLHRRLVRGAQEGRVLEIQKELTSYTVDVASTLAFGHDLNTLERGENELQEHMLRLMRMVSRRLAIPIPYWRWFKLPADRALERSVVEIRRAVTEFIDQARTRLRERPELREQPENLLEGMLAAQETDDSYTDDEIIGNTLAILNAAEDTTALTLGWAIWFLSSRPHIQARLSQEADEVLGDQLFLHEHESAARLRYTEAVVREAIRLKSVVPYLTAESTTDNIICGTHIPAGTRMVLLSHYASLRADGSEREGFDPERWLKDGDGDQQTPNQKTFLGFGAGPRFCPGHNLAFLEAKALLIMVARNFEIELDSSQGPVEEDFAFTMAPKGLRVQLRERSPMQPMLHSATG
jgi:cytochrome P450